jgi:hypothetical protein
MSLQTEYPYTQSVPESGIEPADFETLLRVSMEELMVLTQAHQESWHFGKEEEWHLEMERADLVLKLPGRQVIAAAQIIGSYESESGKWQWSWANPSVPEHLTSDARRLKEYGEQQGIQLLVSPHWSGPETDCWYMAALACRLCACQGAYRGPMGNVYTFLTFGPPQFDPPLEKPEQLARNFLEEIAQEFKGCAESLEEQKRTCCRYFRRGPLAGLSQSQLIDFLALSSPSVLDIAGYSPEAAQMVMDMIGGLSDEEIQNS